MITHEKDSNFLAVLDFEGTSTTNSARATEIGICLVDRNFEIVEEFETLIKPPIEPLKVSLAMARLSKSDLVDAPSFEDVWPSIYQYFNGNAIVAHNKSYEITILQNEFADIRVEGELSLSCTRELSRRLLTHRISSESLDYLCAYFDIQRVSPHEAISDARDTVQLIRHLADVNDAIVDELFSDEKLHNFPVPTWKSGATKIRPRITEFNLGQDSLTKIHNRVKIFGFNLVVITGKPEMGVDEFREVLRSYGLENRETPVTKKTAFVVRCSEKPGNSKIKKALDEGIPVIEEAQLEEVLLSLKTGKF